MKPAHKPNVAEAAVAAAATAAVVVAEAVAEIAAVAAAVVVEIAAIVETAATAGNCPRVFFPENDEYKRLRLQRPFRRIVLTSLRDFHSPS